MKPNCSSFKWPFLAIAGFAMVWIFLLYRMATRSDGGTPNLLVVPLMNAFTLVIVLAGVAGRHLHQLSKRIDWLEKEKEKASQETDARHP